MIDHCDPCHGNCAACEAAERHTPLPPGLTANEHRQQLPSPWTGLNIALALVLAAAVSGLLLHAAARAGWLP